jgi:ubiquinone/menaquinone biosynthesis C-methylase UbiE
MFSKLQLFALLFFICGGIMSVVSSGNDHIISHKESTINLDKEIDRLKASKSLVLPLEREIELLKQLNSFDLGRSLLNSGGVNGYWISYIINKGFGKHIDNELEYWILNKAPLVMATQQRFGIFQKSLQHYLKSNSVMASIPCGVMDDLLGLDYTNVKNVKLIGIDLDQKALDLAEENKKKHHLSGVEVVFSKEDAWKLSATNEYDLITSSGLNIYEPDIDQIIALYARFCKALKPGGILITSFVTPSPKISKDSPWKYYVESDLLMQQAVFGDLVNATWQTKQTIYMTAEQMKAHLIKAGFEVIEVIYDKQCMFPTIVARKV